MGRLYPYTGVGFRVWGEGSREMLFVLRYGRYGGLWVWSDGIFLKRPALKHGRNLHRKPLNKAGTFWDLRGYLYHPNFNQA